MSTRHQNSLIRFRMSPAAIAMTAGAIGSICGALFVFALAIPSTQGSDVAHRPVETPGAATPVRIEQQPEKVEAPPAASATAAIPASVGDESKQAAAECDRQAWPYITQQCLTERSAGQRRVRVITTDKIAAPVVNAIETSREPPGAKAEERQDVTTKERPATATVPTPAVTVTANPAQAVEAKATPAAEASAPAQTAPPSAGAVAAAAPVVPAAAPAAEPKPQHASAKEERSKKARDKRKREAKSRREPRPARGDDDETEDSGARTTRVVERDNSSSHGRGRIVERWTEREYEVPSYNGSQRRRVIVIRRNGDRADAYMPSAGVSSRSLFGY